MRKNWDEYFMDIARMAATRSTCDRKHVGAVIVRERAILSTGYNGSVPGAPHCDDVGHEMENGHCVRTVHAEANAIIQAARNGVRTDRATIYTTASPCFSCFKLIVGAGIETIVFGEMYRDERISDFAVQASILLRDMSKHCRIHDRAYPCPDCKASKESGGILIGKPGEDGFCLACHRLPDECICWRKGRG